MKNNNSKKGFTLIEMLVVVAVISILSGLTLTGIAGFTSRARDTRRLGDMRSMQNYIEGYFSKCHHYPGTAASGTGACLTAAPSNWDGLKTALKDAISASAPSDQVASKTYFYAVTSDQLKYVVGATLENDNRALNEADEIDTMPAGTWTYVSGSSSSCGGLGFCVGS